MKENHMRCLRCRGLKKMFKLGNGYSEVDAGGISVDCPMCLGIGTVKTLESVLKEIENKDVKDVEEPKIIKKRRRPKSETTSGSTDELQS